MLYPGYKMRLIILSPVYNDWGSFIRLSEELYKVTKKHGLQIVRIIGINDSSSEYPPSSLAEGVSATFLNLGANVGHQRAIAIGLAYISNTHDDYDCVLVMDSDGEDNPIFIPELCKTMESNNQRKIVFAGRDKRTEGLMFKLFYRLYKYIFYALTGESITFGNYSCIPRQLLKRLVSIPELWNHYSCSVIRSKLPYMTIATDRGERYYGKPKMSFSNLLIHGLSSISIYMDIVMIRVLALAGIGISIVFFLMLLIAGIRIYTDMAIPG